MEKSQKHLVRLRIDNIKPRYVTCVWLVFFILIGILYLLVFAIPKSLDTYQYKDIDCPDGLIYNNPYSCRPFNILTNPTYALDIMDMNAKKQFFVVYMSPVKKQGINDRSLYKINYTLNVFTMDNERSITDTVVINSTHSIDFSCLDTSSRICETKSIVYQPRIEDTNYLVVVSFEVASFKDKISEFAFQVQSINPSYTNYSLAIRYFCMSISILFFMYYEYQIRKVSKNLWVFEQRFVRALGILVIFFNDPIYAATILTPSMGSAFFSVLFIVTFFCALLLFWICSFERIHSENEDTKSNTFTWQKKLYTLTLWIFSMTAYNILNGNYLDDPGFDFDDEHSDVFNAFKFGMIFMLVIALIWILYGFGHILKKYKSRIWRHKMFFLFSCYFILCYFLFLFTGSMETYNDNGTRVMLVYGVTNIYIWFLEVLYVPMESSVQETNQHNKLANVRETEMQYGVLDESEQQDGTEALDRSEPKIKLAIDPPSGRDNLDDSDKDKGINNPDQIIFGIENRDDEEEDKDKYPFEINSKDE